MKRAFAWMCALAMLLSLGACAKQVEDDTPEETDPPAASEPAATEPGSEPTEPGSEPTEPAEPSAAPETDNPGGGTETVAFSRGTVSGNSYTSEFLGIGCDLGADWTVMSEEEMLSLSNILVENMDNEAIAEALANAPTQFDLYAQQGMNTLNIVLENLMLSVGTVIDAETYLALSATSLAPALEGVGATDVEVVETEVSFAGQTLPALSVTATMSGVALYEVVLCIQQGDYMAAITVGSYVDDNCQQILDLFYAL